MEDVSLYLPLPSERSHSDSHKGDDADAQLQQCGRPVHQLQRHVNHRNARLLHQTHADGVCGVPGGQGKEFRGFYSQTKRHSQSISLL